MAASAHINPEIAIYAALEELSQCYFYAYANLYDGCKPKKEMQNLRLEDIDTLHKHFFYYSTGRHSKNIDFMTMSDECVFLSDLHDYTKESDQENLEYVIQTLQLQGQNAYAVDITNDVIRI